MVEIVDKSENILIREQFHLDFNQSFNDKIGYNISKNATAPMLGRNHTEESKRKIGKASEGNTYSLGIKASDETKDKMSKSRQNISKKTLEKMSLAKLGNKNAIGNKNSVKSSVYQLDLNNNPIKLWEYVAYAAKTLKLPAPNINKVCKGSRETCGGFKWKYAN